MESITPNIFVHNMPQTIDFYKELGFTVTYSVPEKGDFVWVMMSCGTVSTIFQTFKSLDTELPQINRSNGGSLLFYIKRVGIKDFFNQLSTKVAVIKGLEKTFYGATEFSIIDNNGYVITFAENL